MNKWNAASQQLATSKKPEEFKAKQTCHTFYPYWWKKYCTAYMDGENNCYYQDSISCIVRWELMAQMPCNEHTENSDGHYDKQ